IPIFIIAFRASGSGMSMYDIVLPSSLERISAADVSQIHRPLFHQLQHPQQDPPVLQLLDLLHLAK
ncbi:MAG: hypothetical protein WBP88_01730, partial [Nitrososphaeraceae archaeon]